MANRSDNFNRADTATNIGTPSDGGSDWVKDSGNWGISSNQGYSPDPPPYNAVASLEASSAVVRVGFNLISPDPVNPAGAIPAAGPAVRVSDTNNLFFFFPGANVPWGAGIVKVVAGVYTTIAAFDVTPVSGDLFELAVDASNNFTAYQNGSIVGTATDSFNSTATRHGIWSSGPDQAVQRFDNFFITDNSTVSYTLSVANGSIALNGQAVAMRAARTLALAGGAISLNAQALNLVHGRPLALANGTINLSGQALNLVHGYQLSIANGSIALNGQAVTFTRSPYTAVLGNGTINLNGQQVILIYSAAPGGGGANRLPLLGVA